MARRGLSPLKVAVTAADLADEIGLEAVTISEVARRLGVQVPSLYAHVDGASGLTTRVVALSLDELADRAASALIGRSGEEALLAYADAVRGFAHQHPGRYGATRHRFDASTTAAGEAIAAGRRHADLIAAVLRGYALEGDDLVHATRLIGSVIHGFVSLELAGGFDHSAPASEVSWRLIIRTLATSGLAVSTR